ncbi:ferritin-like domain-containing protein [Roseospira marina]|uniref:Ferritin-like domain-containing protein n=1 Tax=Roseospira marina TaxID=140057 RepID=A0A5M6IBP2_9PROT|nr:ferritin-like domain-containing protein [Roseospira marina]KAA5605155.1 ferritin-like domain-containing protein [Roseospira marina]MBB4314911.1 rubrerythrin [Roseospira marina]MBB5087911.1 rubrerythrin [Roseospira marina]
MAHWTLDDIPWDSFDPSRIDPELVPVIKAAALTEHNSGHYSKYLCNVFRDDPVFCDQAETWAEEETRHGAALGRWAELADPTFDFATTFDRFAREYVIDTEVAGSIRGSRSGEMVARCIVETGTSSFYSALRDATDEPVLKAICHRIAGDEFRHFKLFYSTLKRYLERENLSRRRRLLVALSRMQESEDDELAFAYHCANTPDRPYSRAASGRAYAARAFRHYRIGHIDRSSAMVMKAAGLSPHGRVGRLFAGALWRYLRFRLWRLEGEVPAATNDGGGRSQAA